LEEYVKSDDVGDDSASVKIIIEHLKALNSLFEFSLLGKYIRVFKTNGSTLQRVEDGLKLREDSMENSLCNCVCILFGLCIGCTVVLCT